MRDHSSLQKRLSPPWKDFRNNQKHDFDLPKPIKKEISLFTQAELDYLKRKEKVIHDYYMNHNGPVIRKKGHNLFSYGEREFSIFYNVEEKLPSNFVPPEPVLVLDLNRNKIYEIEKFLESFWKQEFERALRRNL